MYASVILSLRALFVLSMLPLHMSLCVCGLVSFFHVNSHTELAQPRPTDAVQANVVVSDDIL